MRQLPLPLSVPRVAVAGLTLASLACLSSLHAQPQDSLEEAVPPPLPPKFKWLDKRNGISAAPNFVSEEETAHILGLVAQAGNWSASKTGGNAFAGPRDNARYLELVNRDPVMARLEARIANVTGIAPHQLEDTFSIAKITSRGNKVRGGYFTPFGLHHETDGRPWRARTVIVYLEAPRKGGRTIFPLCHGRKEPKDKQLHGAFHDALKAQFGGVAERYTRAANTNDPHSTHPFMDLLERACRGKDGMVAMRPRSGWALMFEHIRGVPSMLSLLQQGAAGEEARLADEHTQIPPIEYNFPTWHDGCNVVSGTKILLQKFKELPRALRDPRLVRTAPPVHYNPWRPADTAPGASRVVVEASGALGLALVQYGEGQPPEVESLSPGGLVATSPGGANVRAGMVLATVQGVHARDHDHAVAMIRAAGRPLALAFTA